jgi:hypothetical protein
MRHPYTQTFRPDPSRRRLDSAELRQAIEFWLVAGLSSTTVKDAIALLRAVREGKMSFSEAARRLAP